MVRREVMASNLNDFLGLDLVPLTTLKRGLKSEGVGVGSVQKFVSDVEFGSKGEQRVSQELHRLAGSAKSSAALDKNKPYLEYEQRLLDACFLDDVMGGIDRHPGNVGVDKSGKFYLIDNGASFTFEPKYAWNGSFRTMYLRHLLVPDHVDRKSVV